MKKNRTLLAINNIVCIVLMLVLVGTMFLPSWDFIANIKVKSHTCKACGYSFVTEERLETDATCPECGVPKKQIKTATVEEQIPSNASIMEFSWLAYDNGDLTDHLVDQGYSLNGVVMCPFVLTLCLIFGVIFGIKNLHGAWQSLFHTAGSGLMLVSLLTNPAFKLGPYWMINVIAGALALLASLALLVQWIFIVINWAKAPARK